MVKNSGCAFCGDPGHTGANCAQAKRKAQAERDRRKNKLVDNARRDSESRGANSKGC